MDATEFGPFTNVVAIASALVATFSLLLLKALGRIKHWTWLTSKAPPVVTAGPRVLSVALMAITYVTISRANFGWFAAAAALFGLLGFWAIARFNRLQTLYIAEVPLVGADGAQLVDQGGQPRCERIVIGTESEMDEHARNALERARVERGGLSVRQFMSGYGAQKVNDPEALWDPALLAEKTNALTTMLMYAVLCGVMALYLSAFVIDVAGRAGGQAG